MWSTGGCYEKENKSTNVGISYWPNGATGLKAGICLYFLNI
jgi:hypothetical protein